MGTFKIEVLGIAKMSWWKKKYKQRIAENIFNRAREIAKLLKQLSHKHKDPGTHWPASLPNQQASIPGKRSSLQTQGVSS